MPIERADDVGPSGHGRRNDVVVVRVIRYDGQDVAGRRINQHRGRFDAHHVGIDLIVRTLMSWRKRGYRSTRSSSRRRKGDTMNM